MPPWPATTVSCATSSSQPIERSHQILVALAALGPPAEGVACARFESGGVDAGQVLGEYALPVAVMDFLQALVEGVGGGLQTHGAAHDLHSLAGAQQGAGNVAPMGDAGEQRTQGFAVAPRLGAPGLVHGDVGLTLVARLRVPVGLAVANEVDGDAGAHRSDTLRSAQASSALATVMSGASSFFMPCT